MPYQRECAYPPCKKPFTTLFVHQRCCSRACGAHNRTLETHDQLKVYFLKNVTQTSNTHDCWLWKGSRNDQGYGMAFVRRSKIRAHRLAYELFVGPLSSTEDVLHSTTCTSRACVNWHHLRLGTHQENMRDKVLSGSQPRGSRHYRSRLTEVQVRDILRDFHVHGITISRLSDRYGISVVTVHDIVYRKTWTHVLSDQFPPPSRDGRSTVTPALVQEMRRLYTEQRYSCRALAEKYSLTPDHVRKICLRLAWREVP